jgi:hypothetical protein
MYPQHSADYKKLSASRSAKPTEDGWLESRHCFDAMIAALTAREYADGKTFDPPKQCPIER